MTQGLLKFVSDIYEEYIQLQDFFIKSWAKNTDLSKVVDNGQASAATNHNHRRYQPVASMQTNLWKQKFSTPLEMYESSGIDSCNIQKKNYGSIIAT